LGLLREDGRRVLAKAHAYAEKEGIDAVAVMREIPSGPAADAILRESKKQRADLIVLGTHGRRGLRRLVMGKRCRAGRAQRERSGAAEAT
jgi:nucleotide-binding universal stress UspA family protein